jgi:FtsH-binding integral membrane protein
MGTVTVFACFSAAAYFAERRSYLYLGGLLSSCVSVMLMLGLMNFFFRSYAIHNIMLYVGLMVFSGYVIFDTQLMIEKAAMGETDFVWDCFQLFIDFVAIFVRLLIILSKDKKNEKR